MSKPVRGFHDDDQGGHAPGLPRRPLTETDIAALAATRGETAADTLAYVTSLKAADGKPLYPPKTAEARAAVPSLEPSDRPHRATAKEG